VTAVNAEMRMRTGSERIIVMGGEVV